MEKPQKTKTVSLSLPQGHFHAVFYANRCGVQSVDGHKVVHFGFVGEIGKKATPLAALTCVFDKAMLDHQKKSWLDFLKEIGLPATEVDLMWQPVTEKDGTFSFYTIPFVNAAALCRVEDSAEIRCFNYSVGDATTLGKGAGSESINGQGVALIRCPTELLRHLLLALFDANKLV